MGFLRSALNRLRGSGPCTIAPFAEIANDRTTYAHGIHRAEDFSGILTELHYEPTFYQRALGLEDETIRYEQLPDGPRYCDGGLRPAFSTRVMALTAAGVATSDGIIYCLRTRRAVAETVRQWTAPATDHPLLSAPNFPPPSRRLGRCLNLGTQGGDGFFHFLVESIPRLQYARAWLQYADHVIANGRPGGFQERWLTHAGVPKERIIWLQSLTHFACDQVLFIDYPMLNYQPSPGAITAIRDAFPPAQTGKARRRIWISRSDANNRQVNWERDLLAQLPGFERTILSELTPEAQIQLFSDSDSVVAPHGAGLANLVFCSPGARVVEIFPPSHRQPIYSRLAQLSGLDYRWTVADFSSPQPPPELVKRILDYLKP
jgi:hypothetical protein